MAYILHVMEIGYVAWDHNLDLLESCMWRRRSRDHWTRNNYVVSYKWSL